MTQRRAKMSEDDHFLEQTSKWLRLNLSAHVDSGDVYAVGTEADPLLVKVGFSQNTRERLRILQTGSPHVLDVLASFPGSIGDERAIHASLSAARVSGEWFRLHPEDKADLIRAFTLLAERRKRPIPRGIPTD